MMLVSSTGMCGQWVSFISTSTHDESGCCESELETVSHLSVVVSSSTDCGCCGCGFQQDDFAHKAQPLYYSVSAGPSLKLLEASSFSDSGIQLYDTSKSSVISDPAFRFGYLKPIVGSPPQLYLLNQVFLI
jgi:hypothetical protein